MYSIDSKSGLPGSVTSKVVPFRRETSITRDKEVRRVRQRDKASGQASVVNSY